MSELEGEPTLDLAVQDHVVVETDVAGRRAALDAVLLKICRTELWLGLTSPDRRLETIRLGRPLRLSVARPAAALVGDSEFLRAMGGSRSRVFAVRRPWDLELRQRRAHPRFDVDLPVRFRHLDPATWQPRGRSNPGLTINLSSGGLLLRTCAAVEVGEQLDLMLPLSLGNRISTTDRVVRIAHGAASSVDPDRPEVLEVAVEFTRITSVDREWIVRYAAMAENRRRGATRSGLESSPILGSPVAADD